MAASCRASARPCWSAPSTMPTASSLTGSFMDYAMPRAHDAPDIAANIIRCRPRPIRSASKAAARPAAPAALASVMNAVVDALSDYGIRHLDMPATPERVWQAIQEAKAGRGGVRRHGATAFRLSFRESAPALGPESTTPVRIGETAVVDPGLGPAGRPGMTNSALSAPAMPPGRPHAQFRATSPADAARGCGPDDLPASPMTQAALTLIEPAMSA